MIEYKAHIYTLLTYQGHKKINHKIKNTTYHSSFICHTTFVVLPDSSPTICIYSKLMFLTICRKHEFKLQGIKGLVVNIKPGMLHFGTELVANQ